MSIKIKNSIIFFTLVIAIFAVADFALAAVDPWGGTKTAVEGAIGLGTEDPRIIAASVIRVALGFLGVIALGLIIYAGFLWMTSAGQEQKIEQAKSILKNALIGLIIILASFGIVSFIIEKLLEQTGAGGSDGGQPPQFGAGIGALGDCSITSVYPEPGQQEVPRNTAIVVTFREEVEPATVCDDAGGNNNGICDNGELIIPENIRIFKTGAGDACETTFCADNITEVSVSTNDNKTFVFIPKNYLGSPSEYIWHTVYLSNDILKLSDGKGIFSTCKTDYFEWQFEVSNKIDLEPPQVKEGGIFPGPDDQADEINTTAAAVQASGGITVNSNPNAYTAAAFQNPPVNVGGSEDAAVSGSYNCLQDGTITVSINGATNKAEVSGPLGIVTGDDITDNIASLGCGLTLTPEDGTFEPGNSWTIAVTAEKQPDTLSVGGVTYTFVAGAPVGNQIQLGAAVNNTASNIAAALAGNPDVFAAIGAAPNIINITAKIAGAAGNNIALSTSNTSALTVDPMSGGQDQETIVTVNDAQDKPRNAVIQINFNEAVNPSTVSGSASEMADYIRVVNAELAAPAGGACAADIDCRSFKCDTGVCAGDYLEGKFVVSNQYKTVEFISNNLCGINGCGEKIYCLPENSHVKAELMAAGLTDCGADNCASRSPYNICAAGHCQNSAGENYPLSAAPLDGIADMALNSLDGNRDNGADGPVTFYNENNPNLADGDNYQWSFFINNQIDLAAPEITGIRQVDINGVEQPMNHGDTGIHLVNPILINFSKLMMASSLSTGSRTIESGDENITHQLINIWNFTNKPVGYWVVKTDNDSSVPLDGEPDWTQAILKHSMFADSTGYRAQVGSGVRDIYQNCFKPSKGPACPAVDEANPSCCSGAVSAGDSCP